MKALDEALEMRYKRLSLCLPQLFFHDLKGGTEQLKKSMYTIIFREHLVV